MLVQPTISKATEPWLSPPPLVRQLLPIFSSGINAQERYATWANSSGCQNDVLFFVDVIVELR
uniref:Uncharacterized protein n=1 Tax=Romanomermis culicivorax TaxID=13658 RepID=A0A915KYU0_ROMCU